ncbi:MAG TPA: efflux RND transporter periplasmic adaptor subunit [Vicinamibacterales bacterium]|jgi:cobalt-zinc-cadmium efflux system membrane fusion protein
MMRTAALLGVLSISAACSGGAPAASEVPPEQAPAAERRDLTMTREQIAHGGIRWAPARASSMTETADVPGQLVPNEDRTARLSAPARARVITVHVRIGDRVSRGQPLVTLQSEQAAAARAEYAKAVAEQRAHHVAAMYARTALERAERLLELKAVSRQEVERARVEEQEAESTRSQADAEVERARATLAQLGVNLDTGDMTVRASLAGIVLSRDAFPGSVVDAGAPLVTVTDPTSLWLEIAVTERIATAVRPGHQLTFSVAGLGEDTFTATIENVGAALDPGTRTLPVHAVVRNASGTLRPAMFVTAMVPLGQPRPGVAVPETMIQLLDERPVVFIAQPDDRGGARFERRDVEVGATAVNEIQIVKGLEPGDVVVIEGAFAVKSEFARSRTSAR